jgi:MFS family permease
MKAIKSTWKTLTDTLSVMGQYRSAFLYPLLSFSIMLLVTFSVMIPLLDMAVGIGHETGPARLFLFLAVYFMYGVLYFVIIFFNVALLTRIAGQLEGKDPPFARGILAALQRMGPIARYTLLSATLGLVAIVAKVLTNPLIGGVIIPLVGKRLWLRWRQLSYTIPLLLAVPVIALDQPVPAHFFKRGGLLVKETWGEQVKPAHNIGLLALLVLLIVMLFAIPALHQGSAEHNTDLIRLGSSILLVSILTYTQLNALVNAIFALAAYRYATARKSDVIPGDASYAEHAFVKSKKETDEDDVRVAPISTSPSAGANDLSN